MNNRISILFAAITLATIAVIAVFTLPSLTGLAHQPEINPVTPAHQPSDGWVTDTIGLNFQVYDLILDSGSLAKIIANPFNHYLVLIEQSDSGWIQTSMDFLPPMSHGSISAIMDANDFIHIIYPCLLPTGVNTICYAYQDAVGWNYEESGMDGSFVSMALDKDGYPHFTSGVPPSAVLYAFKDNDGWHSTTVDTEYGIGKYNKLALDVNDYPHITYYNEVITSLKYAYQDTSGWHVQTIFSEDAFGLAYDFVLDSLDTPHISQLAIDGNLYHTYLDGSTWKSELVDSYYETGVGYTSIALTGNDQPRISYSLGRSPSQLRYASLESNAWITQTIDTYLPNQEFEQIVLKLDQDQQPHILYSHFYQGLKYTYYKIVVPISGLTAQVIGELIQGKPASFSASVVEGTYVSYDWDFGDGSTGSGKNTAHVYKESGTYLAAVTAKNSISSDIYTFTVNVLPHTDIFFPIIPESDVDFIYTYSGLCASYDPGVSDVDATITWCVPQVWVRSTGEMQVFTTWTAEISPITTCLYKHSDAGNTDMYLTDEGGGRYDHIETGEAARYGEIICNGETFTGWFLFPPAVQGVHEFTFHDDNNHVENQGIMIGP